MAVEGVSDIFYSTRDMLGRRSDETLDCDEIVK